MATNTYVALNKITLVTATSTITFSSIPSTYTDLVIVFNGTAATATYTGLQFNGDTGSNYSYTQVHGNGTSALSGRSSNATELYTSSSNTVTTTPSVMIVNIQNYANTTTNKTALIRNSNAAVEAAAAVGTWRNTAAITSVTIKTPGTNFAVGSTFSLYGIKSDTNAYTAKATGGVITADVGYIYHTFTSSGTFTPLQSLSCDALVIAGGGGGEIQGGGGAGGYLGLTNQSLSATGYTVTVGGGGAGGVRSTSSAVVGTNSSFNSNSAIGGGVGGPANSSGGTGGSGGGGGRDGGLGGAGTSGQGFAGGRSGTGAGWNGAGGGGGAGAVGSNGFGNNSSGSEQGGNGGIGSNANLSWASATSTGVNGYYAGGGGGGTQTAGTVVGVGGTGGGGTAATQGGTPTSGTTNTGGGGGGLGGTTSPSTAGAGGSGIVIIRYPKA
jgi:hypothetical protein